MNNMRRALIVWAAALLLVATGCRPGPGPASEVATKPPAGPTLAPTSTPLPLLGSVKSEDGAARVDVPVGSLPAGLRVEDIKIAAVDSASLPVKFPDGPALAAYKLEPGGTKFTTPVTFSVTLPSQEAFLPTVAMISGDEISAVLEMDVAQDAEAATLTVSTKLDHFSFMMYGKGSFYTIFLKNPGNSAVGRTLSTYGMIETTSTDAELKVEVDPVESLGGNADHYLLKLVGDSQATYTFTVKRGPVAPSVNPAPPETFALRRTMTRYLNPSFTCVAPGAAELELHVTVVSPVEWQYVKLYGAVTETGAQNQVVNFNLSSGRFQCVAAAPAVKPTTSISPSQNRPPVVSPIQAELAYPSLTTYSVVVSDPGGDVLTALWEGRDCGKPQTFGPKNDRLEGGQGGFEMLWDHAVTFCHPVTFRTPEPLPEHANTVIKVTISDASSVTDAALKKFHWQVVCTYTGVASGTGPACSAPVKVGK